MQECEENSLPGRHRDPPIGILRLRIGSPFGKSYTLLTMTREGYDRRPANSANSRHFH